MHSPEMELAICFICFIEWNKLQISCQLNKYSWDFVCAHFSLFELDIKNIGLCTLLK